MPDQNAEQKQGKTFADVLEGMFRDYKRFSTFLLMTAGYLFLIAVLAWVIITFLFGFTPTQIQTTIGGNQILFQTTTGNKKEYVVAGAATMGAVHGNNFRSWRPSHF